MHRISCQQRLPHQQLINKWYDNKAAAEAKKDRGYAGSKAGKYYYQQFVQGGVPFTSEAAAYRASGPLPICAALNYPCKLVRWGRICETRKLTASIG